MILQFLSNKPKMKIIACIVNSPIFAGNEWFIMDIFVTLHRLFTDSKCDGKLRSNKLNF